MAELVYRYRQFEDFDLKKSTGVLEGRAVPFGVVQRVADADPYREYDEEWDAQAFDGQLAHRAKIGRARLTYNHEPGLAASIGRTIYLESRDDGLYGAWQLDGPFTEKVLREIRQGVLTGLSIGAIPLENVTTGTVVKRVRAHLDHVSLVDEPAFENAKLLAVRSKPPVHRESAAERLAKLREQRERYNS